MSLRAVIFDYGEVISRAANKAVHRQLVETAGLDQETFDKWYWALRLDYDAGILNRLTYFQKLAEFAGTEFSTAQIERLGELDARMWMDINEPMLAWVSQIQRAGLRIAILSNMGDGVLSAMLREFPWLGQFDALVWSHELGIVKPDPAIYRYTVDALAVQPQEALFIDNLQENVAGAEAIGLHAIHFENIDQLGREIARRGFNLPLPDAVAAG
ncbi:MAG TPA: HAD family phosphatase [Acidobacteriaceae bacterium]|jgi:putative hydrolase of the HAD superfamily|nr:HAD family phosphatase [Acidobacteriaceae bacterium]